MSLSTTWILAQRELREALRNRWFALYTVAFAGLSLALSYMSLAGSGTVGFAGFGRTAASLINLVLLVVPLMALTLGGMSLAAERERGTLAYLLAQPVSRLEVFLGKLVGLGLGLLAALALGFGLSGLVMAARGGGADVRAYLLMVCLAFLLGLVMLSIGMVVSAFAQRTSVAVGVCLFLWLAFVFIGDLGMMGTSIVLRLPIDSLLGLSMANPLQVFKMAAVLSINASLDVLGPAGIYATQRYGSTLLAAFFVALVVWALVPAAVAYGRFRATRDL